MKMRTLWILAIGLATAIALFAIGSKWRDTFILRNVVAAPPLPQRPFSLEAVPGQTVKRVIVTQRAHERLGIAMARVVELPGTFDLSKHGGSSTAAMGLAIPYGALLYDSDGSNWVFTSPAPLTFVRSPVTVVMIAEGYAILAAGPPVGTEVVVAGGVELFGAETKIGN